MSSTVTRSYPRSSSKPSNALKSERRVRSLRRSAFGGFSIAHSPDIVTILSGSGQCGVGFLILRRVAIIVFQNH